jgi:hypothetical protein
MEDFYKLSEFEQAQYEREYNDWLDEIEDENSEEDDLLESFDESYTDEDEQVYGYDDLIDREEDFRELDFND